MNNQAIIGLSILLCFIASSIVAAIYIVPHLRACSREDAIKVLAAPHMFRFVGLSFLMPGVVSPTLTPAFANPAAYGDLAAAVLAMIAVLGLSIRASWAMLAVWIFNMSTVHDYFVEWQCDGTPLRIHHALYVQARELAGKAASPTTPVLAKVQRASGVGGR